jgi:hypothetical protein
MDPELVPVVSSSPLPNLKCNYYFIYIVTILDSARQTGVKNF